ncbi:MAG: transglutaminase family protein [Ferruginibacter sp.]
MPAGYEFTPAVFLAPADFQVQDYDGNMDDWKNYGKFIYRLNENRDQLPDNVKQDIHRITDPLTSNKEKIKAAYQYLQQNTRYISVQLGIGGWQTFDAKYVAQNKYGDCKALSNYMYALLKEAGIKSYYTLLHSSGNLNRVMPDFPSTQFNHAILCVPEGKDTTWLECTSQSYPPGYLGSSNSNRPVLLIDENGGQIVNTPRYSKTDNVQLRRITGVIDDNGELKAKVKTDYKAWQHEFYHAVMHELTREKMLEDMKERMDIPSFDINDFSYAEKKSSLPVVEESIDLTVHNFASKTGKRLFVNPNLMNRNNRSFDEQAKRKTNIKVMFGYTDSDSIVIDLPAGYKPESLPSAVNIESPFGKYSSTHNIQ